MKLMGGFHMLRDLDCQLQGQNAPIGRNCRDGLRDFGGGADGDAVRDATCWILHTIRYAAFNI